MVAWRGFSGVLLRGQQWIDSLLPEVHLDRFLFSLTY